MPDRDWLRNLASSRFYSGQWIRPQESPLSLSKRALDECLSCLDEAVGVYNETAHDRLGIVPLVHPHNNERSGSLLIHGGYHLRIASTYEPAPSDLVLTCSLLRRQFYQVEEAHFAQFTACEDTFGGVGWRSVAGETLSTDGVVRVVLVHLLEHSS